MSATSRKNKQKKAIAAASASVVEFKCYWFGHYLPIEGSVFDAEANPCFPKEDHKALIKTLIELAEEDYSDNFRICLKNDPIGEKLYKEASSRGCCGFGELEVKCKSGRTYKVGNNFGH